MVCIAALLERVFLRVGAAESDEQLEKALDRFLTPTILQIKSQHQSVQEKVSVFISSYIGQAI